MPTGGLDGGVVGNLRVARDLIDRVHEGERPLGRLFRDDEFSTLFFIERRSRSVEFALKCLDEEARLLGAPLDVRVLDDRQYRLLITAEVLGLIAEWDSRDSVKDGVLEQHSKLLVNYRTNFEITSIRS